MATFYIVLYTLAISLWVFSRFARIAAVVRRQRAIRVLRHDPGAQPAASQAERQAIERLSGQCVEDWVRW